MSITIVTKLSSHTEGWTSLECISRSIALIKERLAVLEDHEYVAVPNPKDDECPKVVEEIEMLHKQIHHLRKFKVSLVDALEEHYENH